MKVLVVEDNAIDRKLAGMVPKTSGHVVTRIVKPIDTRQFAHELDLAPDKQAR